MGPPGAKADQGPRSNRCGSLRPTEKRTSTCLRREFLPPSGTPRNGSCGPCPDRGNDLPAARRPGGGRWPRRRWCRSAVDKTVTCFSSCVRSRGTVHGDPVEPAPRPGCRRTSRRQRGQQREHHLLRARPGRARSLALLQDEDLRRIGRILPEDGATRPAETETETSALSLLPPGAPSAFLPESEGATARTEIGRLHRRRCRPRTPRPRRGSGPPTIEVISDRRIVDRDDCPKSRPGARGLNRTCPPHAAPRVRVERADVRIRGGMHALALARRRDFADLPASPCRPERVPAKARAQTYLPAGVVERNRAAGDAIDLPPGAAPRESAVRPDRDGSDLFRERRHRLGLSRGADPDDPARIPVASTIEPSFSTAAANRLASFQPSTRFHSPETRALGGHRNPRLPSETDAESTTQILVAAAQRPGREGGAGRAMPGTRRPKRRSPNPRLDFDFQADRPRDGNGLIERSACKRSGRARRAVARPRSQDRRDTGRQRWQRFACHDSAGARRYASRFRLLAGRRRARKSSTWSRDCGSRIDRKVADVAAEPSPTNTVRGAACPAARSGSSRRGGSLRGSR